MKPINLFIFVIFSLYLPFLYASQIDNSNSGDLHWLPVKNMKPPGLHFANVGFLSQHVNICRAPVLGESTSAGQDHMMIPGMLTKNGCQIIHDGAVLNLTNFYVLAGQDNELHWIPITNVKKTFTDTPASGKNILIKDLPPFIASANDVPFVEGISWSDTIRPYSGIKIQGAAGIVGGYGHGNPILICRVKQNGTAFIGAQVFFTANNKDYDACDVVINGKAVRIQNTYELLFCTNPDSKCNTLTDELLNQAASGNNHQLIDRKFDQIPARWHDNLYDPQNRFHIPTPN